MYNTAYVRIWPFNVQWLLIAYVISRSILINFTFTPHNIFPFCLNLQKKTGNIALTVSYSG